MITLNMKKRTDKRAVHVFLPDGSSVELHIWGDVNYGAGPRIELEVMKSDTRPGSIPQWQTVYASNVRDIA